MLKEYYLVGIFYVQIVFICLKHSFEQQILFRTQNFQIQYIFRPDAPKFPLYKYQKKEIRCIRIRKKKFAHRQFHCSVPGPFRSALGIFFESNAVQLRRAHTGIQQYLRSYANLACFFQLPNQMTNINFVTFPRIHPNPTKSPTSHPNPPVPFRSSIPPKQTMVWLPWLPCLAALQPLLIKGEREASTKFHFFSISAFRICERCFQLSFCHYLDYSKTRRSPNFKVTSFS